VLSIAFVIQNPIFYANSFTRAVVLAAKHRFWQPNTSIRGSLYQDMTSGVVYWSQPALPSLPVLSAAITAIYLISRKNPLYDECTC
jgi:hypothetical protein